MAGTATLDDISDLVSSSSANNVIDDANSAGGLTNSVGNNQIGVSAGLAAGLADNGGSTQTVALDWQPGDRRRRRRDFRSNGPDTDQRGRCATRSKSTAWRRSTRVLSRSVRLTWSPTRATRSWRGRCGRLSPGPMATLRQAGRSSIRFTSIPRSSDDAPNHRSR